MRLKLPTCKQTLIKDNQTAISNPDIIRTHLITLKTTQTYIVLMKSHDNMSASCRLCRRTWHESSSVAVQVIFYLWAVRCLPQNTPGGSYTFTGEDGPGCRGGGLQLGWCPRFSFLHRVSAVRWKLTHFTSLQQQQQHMLRQTHALLASFVNPFYPAAQPADSLEVPSVCVDPQGVE